MNKIISNLRYFTDPQYRFPTIPKINIKSDGFLLNGNKVDVNSITSVLYKNKYSPANTAFSLVGHSYYSILTNNNRMFFYGEHEELANLFDDKLEKETHLENNILGLVKRWKKTGEQYKSTSFFDTLSKSIIEKYLYSELDNRLIWIIILFSLTILIVGVILLFILI